MTLTIDKTETAQPLALVPVPSHTIATIAEPGGLAPGVYFGLDEEVYHADPAIGSTDMRRLVQGAPYYWWDSKWNPDRPVDTDSAAKLWGRAFHKLVLEGVEAYDRAYVAAPDLSLIEGLLDSADDLKGRIKELIVETGTKIAQSGTKAEMIARIREHDKTVPIADEIMAAFERKAAADNQVILNAKVDRDVRRTAGLIASNPHLANAFQGGVPEVSVFWVERGIRFKCRIDYLKPRVAVDLKTLANQMQRPIDDALKFALAEYRLDIQGVHNLDGYCALLDHAEAGRIFGDCPLPDGWWKAMAEPDEIRWTWVFTQKTGAPVSKGVEVAPGSRAFARAAREVEQAKRTYLDALAQFGTAQWLNTDPIKQLDMADLPVWLRESEADLRSEAA